MATTDGSAAVRAADTFGVCCGKPRNLPPKLSDAVAFFDALPDPSGVDGKAAGAPPATARPASPATTANPTPGDVVRAFHVTTDANAQLILQEGFRIPTQQDAVDRGLKAGAAAYFGVDPEYCLHEAVNSVEMLRKEEGLPTLSRSAMARGLVCLEAEVSAGRTLSLGDYRARIFPLRDVTLPTGERHRGGQMSQRAWDQCTELITSEYLARLGFDSVTINDGTKEAELAIYDRERIRRVWRRPDVLDVAVSAMGGSTHV